VGHSAIVGRGTEYRVLLVYNGVVLWDGHLGHLQTFFETFVDHSVDELGDHLLENGARDGFALLFVGQFSKGAFLLLEALLSCPRGENFDLEGGSWVYRTVLKLLLQFD